MYVLLIRRGYVRDVVCNFSTYVELVREPQFLLLIPKKIGRAILFFVSESNLQMANRLNFSFLFLFLTYFLLYKGEQKQNWRTKLIKTRQKCRFYF